MATEKRLIDANALLEEVDDLYCELYRYVDYNVGVEDAASLVANAPTVDAVEVVRCKDCRYFLRHTQVDTDRGDCCCYGITACRIKHIDDYCSGGRREEHEID